jgi:hypothetical protein
MGTLNSYLSLDLATSKTLIGSYPVPISATVTREVYKSGYITPAPSAQTIFTNGTDLADVDVLYIAVDKDSTIDIAGTYACKIKIEENRCLLIFGTHSSTEWTTIKITSSSAVNYTIYAGT